MRFKRILTASLLPAVAAGLAACQSTLPTPETVKPAAASTAAELAARNLANNCFACHGPAGRSPGAVPSLSNLSANDIAVKLKNFKSGAAPSTVMGRQAKGYSDAEIDAVANYIAGLRK